MEAADADDGDDDGRLFKGRRVEANGRGGRRVATGATANGERAESYRREYSLTMGFGRQIYKGSLRCSAAAVAVRSGDVGVRVTN